MTFREWAEGRGYRVRRGDGEPLRGWPYGPDAGEEYVRIRRGWIDDSTGKDSLPTLGIVVFGRKLSQYEGLQKTTFASRSSEDLLLHIPMADWSEEHERIFRPTMRRSCNFTPEQREAIGRRLKESRAGRASLRNDSDGESA
jgi:hypothetical protein